MNTVKAQLDARLEIVETTSFAGMREGNISAVTGQEPGLISPEMLARWILLQSEDVVVVDKPAGVVCHPSKRGPWSSLVGALREHLGVATLHLVSRLDRETSGVVVVARHTVAARRFQMAMQNRRVRKTYLAILSGELREPATVDAPIARDMTSAVAVKRRAAAPDEPDAETAATHFAPLSCGGGFTFVRVIPETGRTHQIRVHAGHIGHAIAGDKLYGPDEQLYLEFTRQGWTQRHAALLPLPRHALHAASIRFFDEGLGDYVAPIPADLAEFARERMGVDLRTAWDGAPGLERF